MLSVMQGFFLFFFFCGMHRGEAELQPAASVHKPPNWPAWTRRESVRLRSSAKINNTFARRLRKTMRGEGGERS